MVVKVVVLILGAGGEQIKRRLAAQKIFQANLCGNYF
jgi:hypothetical protein